MIKTHRKIFAFILLLAIAQINGWVPLQPGEVLGASTEEIDLGNNLEHPVKIQTETAFDQFEDIVYEDIPYPTEYVDDDEMEYGLEEVLEEGVDGVREKTYLVTHWLEEEIYRQLINTEVTDPKPEVIAQGTKVVWRELMTPDAGGIWYWHKIKSWATKYDANCIGCTGRTYSGTQVKKGVCATDPAVIPLGTNFYVEGYGLCRAEDIGGAIDGNDVDLGYENVAEGSWRTGYTNVYLITNAPDGSSKY